MIIHYFKVAVRSLLKNGVFSIINISGLALGLASVFLIIQYLREELSYDRYHTGAENIYRITWDDENPQTRVPHPMALAMVQDFPEVESAVSLTPLWGPGLTRRTFSIRNIEDNIRYDESNVLAVDTNFFDVFTFPLVRGDQKTVLKNPNGILISESMAKKYFGSSDPMGRHLAVNDEEELVEVLGVFKDVPVNSHFHFDILVSYVREKAGSPGSDFFTWNDFGHYNYIRLRPGSDASQLESRLLDWIPKYINWSPENIRAMKARGFGFRLQPLTDIHLRSRLRWELEANGNISYVYMMTAAAILILIIACANFINLTTALSAERAREIGVRKSLGAIRNQLAFQFIGESVGVALASVVLASLLIELSLPFLGSLLGKQFLPFSGGMGYAASLLALAFLGLCAGLVSGIYPSLFLASLNPVLILKGKYHQGPRRSGPRRVFTVFQFVASMVLISSSLVIYSQLDFIRHKSLGFNKDEVVIIPVKNRNAINPRIDELRNQLLRIPGIKAVSATSNIPGRSFNQNPVFASNHPELRVNSSEAMIDYDLFNVLGIELAEGRTFEKGNAADLDAFVVNETTARNLYPEGAVGKEFSWDYDTGIRKGTIIGVVKDFHFQSLHLPIQPLLFSLSPRFNFVVIKLSTNEFTTTIKDVERTWRTFDEVFDFDYLFLEDQLNQQYASEENMGKVVGTFSLIAVAIACFGLLGIAALNFRQMTKEICIRKVLGSTVPGLMVLLMKDFTRWVIIAVTLAAPLSWWMMNQWLENFEFRTEVNPMIFLASGAFLVLISWVTLSYLTLNTARVNPAEQLKSE